MLVAVVDDEIGAKIGRGLVVLRCDFLCLLGKFFDAGYSEKDRPFTRVFLWGKGFGEVVEVQIDGRIAFL